jgi:hypothetical protein
VKAWIAGGLGVCAGAVIVIGYYAMDSRTSRDLRPETPALPRPGSPLERGVGPGTTPFATSAPHPAPFVGQGAEPTGPPAPARRTDKSSEAARPSPDLSENPPLPPYLQKHLESDPPGIALLHSELAHEARDPTWAPATEYQMQEALQEAAPELLARIQLYQTTCASSLCEMVGEFNAATPEQRSQDMTDWQDLLHQAPALNSWKATGLGPPLGGMFFDTPEGHPAFIIEFRKAPIGNKSAVSRKRLTHA